MMIEKQLLPLLKKINLPTLIWDNDVLLFNLSDALKFMDFCDENKINVLGMDGFRILKNKRQPDLNYIYDGETTVINRNFLQKDIQNNYEDIKNIYFEFILEENIKDILNPNDLVYNYKKILDFMNKKAFPIMRWEDNFLDEDMWANNIKVLDNFHKSLKYCFIDYPLNSYKVELYCDKECKLLFNDLYSSYNNCLTHDKYPNDIVKYSVKSNNKIVYKTMSIQDCVFTLKKLND